MLCCFQVSFASMGSLVSAHTHMMFELHQVGLLCIQVSYVLFQACYLTVQVAYHLYRQGKSH